MRTTKKWLAAMAVAALTIGLTGFAASTAGATEEVDPHAGQCLIDPGQAEEGHWTEEIPEVSHVVPSEWWNFEPNNINEPFVGTPGWPDEPLGHWTYHGTLPPGQAGDDGVYQNGVGNGDWFYRVAAVTVIDQEYVPSEWVIDQEYIPETWGDCVVSPDPTLFNAAPEPASCLAPGTFNDGALGGELVGWDEAGTYRDYDFDHFFLSVDLSEEGQVTLYIWADDGYTLEGLSDLWNVDEDGTFASRTILLADQLVGPNCLAAPDPIVDEDVASVSQCVVPANGTATLVTTTTPWTQGYVWVEDETLPDGGSYVLGEKVYGDPVSVTTTVVDAGCAAKAPPTTAVPGNPSFTG